MSRAYSKTQLSPSATFKELAAVPGVFCSIPKPLTDGGGFQSRRWQDYLLAVVYERLQISGRTQPVQLLSHEGWTRQPLLGRRALLGAPGQELARDVLRIRLTVHLLLAQDMPDDDQQLTGDGHDRLLSACTRRQTLEGRAPVLRVFDGHPGSFDQRRTQLAPTLLGDPTGMKGLSGGMHPGAETAVADQLFRAGKALDLADGGQKYHCREHTYAGQLHEERHLLSPGRRGTQAQQLALELRQLRCEIVQQRQVLTGPQAFGRGQGLAVPPRALVLCKESTVRRWERVTVQDRVQAIARLGAQIHHAPSVSHEPAQFTHPQRRHPDRWDEAGGQQPSQFERILAVRLDARGRDQLDQQRMGHGERTDMRDELVVQGPGIAGRFEHHRIGRQQVFRPPLLDLKQATAPGRQDNGLLRIDSAEHHVIFVQIDADEAQGLNHGYSIHTSPPLTIQAIGAQDAGPQVHTPIRARRYRSSQLSGLDGAVKQSHGLTCPIPIYDLPHALRPWSIPVDSTS